MKESLRRRVSVRQRVPRLRHEGKPPAASVCAADGRRGGRRGAAQPAARGLRARSGPGGPARPPGGYAPPRPSRAQSAHGPSSKGPLCRSKVRVLSPRSLRRGCGLRCACGGYLSRRYATPGYRRAALRGSPLRTGARREARLRPQGRAWRQGPPGPGAPLRGEKPAPQPLRYADTEAAARRLGLRSQGRADAEPLPAGCASRLPRRPTRLCSGVCSAPLPSAGGAASAARAPFGPPRLRRGMPPAGSPQYRSTVVVCSTPPEPSW